MRIKVSTVKLIAAIETQKKLREKKYLTDMSNASNDRDDYRAQVVTRLQEITQAVKQATTVKAISKALERYELNFPSAPDKPELDTHRLDEAIKRLKLTDEEFMTLDDKDDYFRYV